MDAKDLVALTAAVVAAALAAAKLVADKESKVSEFRANWISSFREALAECLAEAHAISGRIRIRAQHQDINKTTDDAGSLESELTDHWYRYRKAYRSVLLHLNFAETSLPLTAKESETVGANPDRVWRDLLYSTQMKAAHMFLDAQHRTAEVDRLSQASPAALELTSQLEILQRLLLGPYEDIGKKPRYDRIDAAIAKATLLGNLVIKPEWNRIKRGERTHRLAIALAAILVSFGFVALAMSAAG